MKATGVVRRIDELGRIVIPKEIRRTLKIKEGTPLEIYSGENGELLLKKYSPILEISDFASEVAESIFSATDCNVIVTNMDKVISASGHAKNSYINKNIDAGIEKMINSRKAECFEANQINTMLFADQKSTSFAICPIISAGDVFGAIIIFSTAKGIGEAELNIGKAFADFLGKQVG